MKKTLANRTTRQRLELFITKSEELNNSYLVKHGMQAEYKITWNANDKILKSESVEPDEEYLKSFLTLFRQFISEDEPIFIQRIFNDCEKNITDDTIIRELRTLRLDWNNFFKNMGAIEINIDGNRFTSECVLDLLINGKYFHNDLEKAEILSKLERNNIRLTRIKLFSELPNLTSIIIGLGKGIKKCIHDEKFIFIDEN